MYVSDATRIKCTCILYVAMSKCKIMKPRSVRSVFFFTMLCGRWGVAWEQGHNWTHMLQTSGAFDADIDLFFDYSLLCPFRVSFET